MKGSDQMNKRFVLLVTLLLVALILPGCAGYYSGYGYYGNGSPYGHGYYRHDYGYPHGYYYRHHRHWDGHRR
jgi:hypothetical protein